MPSLTPANPVTFRSALAMLTLAIVWGLSIPLTKLGLAYLPPLTLTALRFAVAVPLFLFYTIKAHPLPRRAMPRVVGLGIVGIGVGQVAQAYGIAYTTASVATVISATIPMFVVMFAALRLKQSVTVTQAAGMVCALVGIGLVAMGRQPSSVFLSAPSILMGAALVLLSAVTIAFYYVWSVELTEEYGTATVAAWSTIFGFLSLTPWAGYELLTSPAHFTVTAVAVAVYLGAAVTVFGLFLWLNLLRTVPARIAASVQYLQPLFGVVAAYLMFGDYVGGLFFGGVALVLVGLALTIATQRSAKSGPT